MLTRMSGGKERLDVHSRRHTSGQLKARKGQPRRRWAEVVEKMRT